MNLYTVEEKVDYVLREYEDSRSDDFILTYRVYQEINENVATRKLFCDVMLNHVEYKLPSIESIVRARRKIFEKYPDLKPEKVSKKRNEKIKEYKEYSRS